MKRLSPNSLKSVLDSIRAARNAPLLTLADAVRELREGKIQPLQLFNQLPDNVREGIDALCQAESGKTFNTLSLEAQSIALVDALTEQDTSQNPQQSINETVEKVLGKLKTEKVTRVEELTIKLPGLTPTQFELIKDISDKFDTSDYLKLEQISNRQLIRSDPILLPLDDRLINRLPSGGSGGPTGARLSTTNERQSSSRSYSPSYSSSSSGYSPSRSRSRVGTGIIFGFYGLLLGLLLAGIVWTVSWVLHSAFAWEFGRAVVASRGWWIGAPLGGALIGIVVGLLRDH